jgi:hypothetical protein
MGRRRDPHQRDPALATSPVSPTDHEPARGIAAFLATVPMRYAGECRADIGRFVALLCSDGSRYVNGQCIAH